MTPTTSLIVGNLTTTSAYVDSFIVEVYSDSGLTTLVCLGNVGAWRSEGTRYGTVYVNNYLSNY
jgi:hypothetical protein